MHITSITFRKKRGVSTIMGTIIFIGIMFTSVIPMLLVMKQADNRYAQKVHEMEYEDQHREDEIINTYAFPVSNSSDDVKVRAENQGVLPIKIVRVWINDDPITQNVYVHSQDYSNLGPFIVAPENGDSFTIRVVTDRGNVYASSGGTLYFNNGIWYTPSLGIVVSISNLVGKYKIWVENSTWGPILSYETQGIDWGDVIHTIMVEVPDTYTVTIEKKQGGGNWIDLPGTPVIVQITWPNGSPIVNVIADGIGF